MVLFTIGYESITLPELVDELRRCNVNVVLDVRQNPISRKPGFSRTALSVGLQVAGIRYEHAAAFGCPRSIRDEYRETMSWVQYQASYLEHLSTLDDHVAALALRSYRERLALLCFEANPNFCHRSLVASAVGRHRRGKLTVTHLMMPSQAQAARRYDRFALAGNTLQ